MVKFAYPDGIPESDYHAVIKVLLEKLSVRNCKDVVGHFVDATHGVYNDTMGIEGGDPRVDEAELERVRTRLRPFSYDAWLAEAD